MYTYLLVKHTNQIRQIKIEKKISRVPLSTYIANIFYDSNKTNKKHKSPRRLKSTDCLGAKSAASGASQGLQNVAMPIISIVERFVPNHPRLCNRPLTVFESHRAKTRLPCAISCRGPQRQGRQTYSTADHNRGP